MTRRGWIYIGSVLLVGLMLSMQALVRDPQPVAAWSTFGGLVVAATLAQLFKSLFRSSYRTDQTNTNYSPLLVFLFAGVILLSRRQFLLLVLLPHLIEWGRERLRKSKSLRDWYIQPVNIAIHLIAGFSSIWLVDQLLGPTRQWTSGPAVLALTLAACLYIALNHLLVGGALLFARGVSFRESGVFTIDNLLPDLIMASLGYLVAVLWNVNPWLIAAALSPLIIINQALRVLAKQARIAAENGQLYQQIQELYGEVQQEASRSRAILQSIADGVVVCAPDGTINLVNPTASRMLDLAVDDLYGKSMSELPLQRLADDSDIFADTQHAQLYTAAQRTFSLTTSAVIGADDQDLGEVIILHDVTVQHEIDRMKSDLIATISHELRTPLTLIKGSVDMLLLLDQEMPLQPDQMMLVQMLQKHAHSMMDLLNNVILLASIEAGTMQPHLTATALAPLVNEALESLQPKLDAKGLSVTVNLPADLPAALIDLHQTQIVLRQLLDNAQRYTTTGGLTINGRYGDEMVHVDIIDTGCGIAPEDVSRLFNRFSRGGEQRGMTSQERGAGLGLAITRHLIEQQHGSITLTSELGKGSIFSCSFPVADSQLLSSSPEMLELAM